MPEIIGKFDTAATSVRPLEAHIGHLRHLTNQGIVRDILKERHDMTAAQAQKTAKLVCPHVAQSLNFHNQSCIASPETRPVLQYYSYLNLAVAVILAYRPPNNEQYRQHGVEDRTHSLKKLELGSELLKVRRGAVPLFHSIISDVPLYNRKFRFGQLAAGFHMVQHELETQFNKKLQGIIVTDEVKEDNGSFKSIFSFNEKSDGNSICVSSNRLEKAMPLLVTNYNCKIEPEKTVYTSKSKWSNESAATKVHRKNGMKLINFGGHLVNYSFGNRMGTCYTWHGISRTDLLPTLTSMLLLSFSLASIVRYRPIILSSAMASPIALLIDTFVTEADSIYIPALRNLLCREEVAYMPIGYV